MICPICKKNIKDDSKFCGKCGHKIPRCPTCGKVIDKQIRFCIYDGTPIPEELLILLPNASGVKVAEENKEQGQNPEKNQNQSAGISAASSVPQQNMESKSRFCIQCGMRFEEDGQMICPECRQESAKETEPVPVLKKPYFCIECGKPCHEGESLCVDCQEKLYAPEESKKSGINKKVVVALSAFALILMFVGGSLVIYMIMNDGFSARFSEDNQVESIVEKTESSNDFESDSEETSEEESIEEETDTETETETETEIETETETEADTETQTETEENNTIEDTEEENYLLSGSDYRLLSKDELRSMSEYELKLARNEIYARHGRKFKDSNLQAYFDGQSWYKGTIDPDEFDDTKMLNEIEKANLDTIMEVENEKTGKVSENEESEKNEYADAEEVNVGNQGITDISPYVSNANLEKLISYGNPLEDFTPIIGLKKLKGLDLANTGLTNIDFLSGMKQLEELWIGENAISDISVVQNFTNLKTLDFWYTDISDISVFSKLSKLENVYMSYSNVTTLKPLMDLPNLKILSISGLTLPQAEYDEFVQRHPDCKIYQEGTKFI